MKIIIDGDACPSIPFIESVAKKYSIEVIIFCDVNHLIKSDYSTVRIVDKGFQSVDMYVVNNTTEGDIVVTQDYGVAALCLGKKAKVISTNGTLFTDDNIDVFLRDRHIAQAIRNAGGRTKGHKKRSNKDEEKLIATLTKIIMNEHLG